MMAGRGVDHFGPFAVAFQQVRADLGVSALGIMIGGLANVVQQAAAAGEAAEAACADLDCGNEVRSVWHARTSASVAQSVLDKIDPRRFDPGARFGNAFYVAENGQTAVDELAAHSRRATHVIRYGLDLSKTRILDLTDPSAAKAWGYVQDVKAYTEHQALARRALAQGYNMVKYQSYRGAGNNYALLENFDFNSGLTPLMISPGP